MLLPVIEPTTVTSPAPRGSDLPAVAIVGVTVIAAFVAGNGLWFFSDDWNIIAGYPSGHLLEPFNSHLSLVPVGVYQVLFHTFGLESYVPFRVVGLLAYAVLGWVTWRYARDRIGTVGGALATAAVLWNSGGVTNVMFPFLMNFSLPIAAVAAIWWHLDHDTPRHDVAASLWLTLALATSGLGLMVAVAVGVELVWTAARERRIDGRRWLVLVPGPALWLAWYVAYGVDSPSSGGVRPVVSYAARMIWGGFGSLAGGNRWLGLVVAAGFGWLLVLTVVRRRFDARLAGALGAPLAFAVLTAISRIGVVPAIPPDELRYQWTIGAFLVLAAVSMFGGLRADEANAWVTVGRPLAGLATVSIVAGVVVLAGDVREWNRSVEAAVPGVRTNLWVAETAAAAGVLDRDRQLPVSYVRVTAGEYVDAVAALGSPLDGQPASAYGGTADARRTAVEAFVADFGMELRPDGPDRCSQFAPDGQLPFAVPIGGAVEVSALAGPVDVRLSLFGPDGPAGADSVEIDTLEAGESGYVVLPDLGDDPPVTPTVTVGAPGEVSLCRPPKR